MSQDRLAYRSGVSLKNIQRVEKLPAASCRTRTLRQLAAALSDDPDTLIRELTQGFTASPDAGEPRQRPQRRRGGQWWRRAERSASRQMLKNPELGMMGYDTLQLSNYEKL
jgi:hypothetical protein